MVGERSDYSIPVGPPTGRGPDAIFRPDLLTPRDIDILYLQFLLKQLDPAINAQRRASSTIGQETREKYQHDAGIISNRLGLNGNTAEELPALVESVKVGTGVEPHQIGIYLSK